MSGRESVLIWFSGSLLMLVHLAPATAKDGEAQEPLVLKPDSFKHYVDTFNKRDEEQFTQYVPNAESWEFLEGNIPLFECPDKDFELTYYFRWWIYRKHIKKTADG